MSDGDAETRSGVSCALEAGRTTLTISSGGRDRIVVVHVPERSSTGPLPLVLDLHGSNSTPTEQLSRSQLDKAANTAGFIVAAPQGALPAPAGFVWNVPFTSTDVPGAPDDGTFLQAVIDTLVGLGCVDANRVYATGYSGGGRMVSRFACDNPGSVAAIAPVAGLRAGAPLATSTGFVPDPSTFTPVQAVPVIAFNGTADPVNPFSGGGPPYWSYGALAASEQWATLNGCETVHESRVSADVTLIDHRGRLDSARVQQYVIRGGGHTWPGADPAAFPGVGETTKDIDASALMWRFFEHRRTS